MRRVLPLLVPALLGGCSLWVEEEKPGPRTTAYACQGGLALEVIFNPVSRIATVSTGGTGAVLLVPVEVASGAAWENGGFRLHTQGAEAVWTVDGQSRTCTEIAAPAGG